MTDAFGSAEHEALIRRYQHLVDRKFLGTLTGDEEVEMHQLDTRLEEIDGQYYEPIIAKLRARVGDSETSSSVGGADPHPETHLSEQDD